MTARQPVHHREMPPATPSEDAGEETDRDLPATRGKTIDRIIGLGFYSNRGDRRRVISLGSAVSECVG